MSRELILKSIVDEIKIDYQDEEAMLIVTETNLMQRSFSDMLHSERVTGLFEHHKALTTQGKRTDLLKMTKLHKDL